MYVNYLQDRKILGYEALNDTKCGTELMEIIDSTALFVKKVSLIITAMHLYLANRKSNLQIVHFKVMEIITNHLRKLVILMQVSTNTVLTRFLINLIMIIQIILDKISILQIKNV